MGILSHNFSGAYTIDPALFHPIIHLTEYQVGTCSLYLGVVITPPLYEFQINNCIILPGKCEIQSTVTTYSLLAVTWRRGRKTGGTFWQR